ncbi:MAG TPA: hypothetical protein VM841_15705 [Actinomycetota bacterium]|nr:hypothetical protein [Actinomycetota bacterium]
MAIVGAAAEAAALAAQAAARGIKPPVRLSGVDARAWMILASGGPARAGDALMLDEYGDLWWGYAHGPHQARVTRACWPEEAGLYVAGIRSMMELVLGAPAPAAN